MDGLDSKNVIFVFFFLLVVYYAKKPKMTHHNKMAFSDLFEAELFDSTNWSIFTDGKVFVIFK